MLLKHPIFKQLQAFLKILFAPLVQANVDQDTELEYVRATYKKDGSTSIDFIDTISGELETVTLAHFTSRCEVAFKDVNEDGNLDIVVATPESKKVLLGDGTGKFIKQF